MGREGWWALRSVRLSVVVCLSTHPAGGQRRVARWWPREGALWPGKGHERQHWARTVGSWQRPSRRSVSQKPKDRRSRSQPAGGTGAAALAQARPPLCSLRLFLEAACFQPNLAHTAGDSPQLPPRPACSRRCPGGAGRQHQPWAWASPGPGRGMRQPQGSPSPASSSGSKLHICRRVCCSHGDLSKLLNLLGGGPRPLLCQYPPPPPWADGCGQALSCFALWSFQTF